MQQGTKDPVIDPPPDVDLKTGEETDRKERDETIVKKSIQVGEEGLKILAWAIGAQFRRWQDHGNQTEAIWASVYASLATFRQQQANVFRQNYVTGGTYADPVEIWANNGVNWAKEIRADVAWGINATGVLGHVALARSATMTGVAGLSAGTNPGSVSSSLRLELTTFSSSAALAGLASLGDAAAQINTSFVKPLVKLLLYLESHSFLPSPSVGAWCNDQKMVIDLPLLRTGPNTTNFYPLSSLPLIPAGGGVVPPGTIVAKYCTADQFLLQSGNSAGGVVFAQGWTPETWGNSTAVIPLSKSWLNSPELIMAWTHLFLAYPFIEELVDAVLQNFAGTQLGAATFAQGTANNVAIDGPRSLVLYVICDLYNVAALPTVLLGTGALVIPMDDSARATDINPANSFDLGPPLDAWWNNGGNDDRWDTRRGAFHSVLQWWVTMFGNQDDWDTALWTVANYSARWVANPRYYGTTSEGIRRQSDIVSNLSWAGNLGDGSSDLDSKEVIDFTGVWQTSALGELPFIGNAVRGGLTNSNIANENPVIMVMVGALLYRPINRMSVAVPSLVPLLDDLDRRNRALAYIFDNTCEKLGMSETVAWNYLEIVSSVGKQVAISAMVKFSSMMNQLLRAAVGGHMSWDYHLESNQVAIGISTGSQNTGLQRILFETGMREAVCPRRTSQVMMTGVLGPELLPNSDQWTLANLFEFTSTDLTVTDQTGNFTNIRADMLSKAGPSLTKEQTVAYRTLCSMGKTWANAPAVAKDSLNGLLLSLKDGTGLGNNTVLMVQVFQMPGRAFGMNLRRPGILAVNVQPDRDNGLWCYNIPCLWDASSRALKRITLQGARSILAGVGELLAVNLVIGSNTVLKLVPESNSVVVDFGEGDFSF